MAKRNKYSDEMKSFVQDLVDNQGFSVTKATQMMCEQFEIKYTETVGRKFRHFMNPDGGILKIEESPIFKKARSKKHDSEKKRFIISSAQSGTPVHKKFLKNMEVYAKFIDAEILIVATRYKNPTSLSASKAIKDNEFWDKSVQPYLTANRNELHKYLDLAAELKISPTASMPLSGLNGMSGLSSMIVGHPRIHFKSLPVLDDYPSKILATTGSCTMPDYTDTKAGKRGEFHHSFGFAIVEIDKDDVFHVRQVTATTSGSFYDLMFSVSDGENVVYDDVKPALIVGDWHAGETCEISAKATKEMLKLFSPKNTILHDVFTGISINRHEKKDPFVLMKKEQDGQLDLRAEIKMMLESIGIFRDHNPVVVRSNHDIFLERHLIDTDWRREPNKQAYLELSVAMARGEAEKGLIPYLINKAYGDAFRCLTENCSLIVRGWELGIHGHAGASGSRGGGTQFKNLNTKSVTAHGHNPERMDGWAAVGTNTKLRLGYNKGLSNWVNGNGIVHPDGKFQNINIINGRWTTLI